MQQEKSQFRIALALIIFLMITRASHASSPFIIIDATYTVMLLGGILLKNSAIWFGIMVTIASFVDLFIIGIVGMSTHQITIGYYALLPAYAIIWIGGYWLRQRSDPFAVPYYIGIGALTSTIAFMISNYSYLFSTGQFQRASSLTEAMQIGLKYYPSYLGCTIIYLLFFIILRYIYLKKKIEPYWQVFNTRKKKYPPGILE